MRVMYRRIILAQQVELFDSYLKFNILVKGEDFKKFLGKEDFPSLKELADLEFIDFTKSKFKGNRVCKHLETFFVKTIYMQWPENCLTITIVSGKEEL